MSFLSEDKVKASITYWQLLKGLWPYTRRHPWMLASTLFTVTVVAGASRLLPTIVGYAIDHGALTKNAQVFLWCAVAFLLTEIIHSVSQFYYLYIFQKLGNRVLYYLREDLVKHVQKLPMTFFNKTPTGRIITRLNNDTSTLSEVFSDTVVNLFMHLINMIAILVFMSMISVKLTLITLCTLPVFVYLAYRIAEKQRIIMRETKKKLSEMNSFASENLSGIKVVQLYNRVNRHRARFLKYTNEYREMVVRTIRQSALLVPVMNLFTGITISISIYYGGFLATDVTSGLALGTLVAFIMHVQDFIPPLRETLEKYQQLQNSLTSAERVFHLLEEPMETDSGLLTLPQKQSGTVEIKNLNFSYEPQLPNVLKNLNLTIPQGKSLAIVGRTGSGKSTLVALLQRFYQVPERSIFIDGHAIEDIPLPTLRHKIGMIQQDNFIFRGSIRDNVSLGDPTIPVQQVESALQQVGYLSLLKRSGRGLDTHVEERGANLSAGERQLLAFARIMAFQPEILILDEATANIDSETEQLIQKATWEITRGRTSIIIAHRLSTIEKCDTIVVLQEGQILEKGSHQELIKNKGVYASYVAEAGE